MKRKIEGEDSGGLFQCRGKMGKNEMKRNGKDNRRELRTIDNYWNLNGHVGFEGQQKLDCNRKTII